MSNAVFDYLTNDIKTNVSNFKNTFNNLLTDGVGGDILQIPKSYTDSIKNVLNVDPDTRLSSRILPRYGYFGGQEWSANQWMPYNTTREVDIMLSTEPQDKLDAAYKVHDLLYSAATSIEDLKKADRRLLNDLEKIKDVNSSYGKVYKQLSKKAFNYKLNNNMYDAPSRLLSSQDRKRIYDYLRQYDNPQGLDIYKKPNKGNAYLPMTYIDTVRSLDNPYLLNNYKYRVLPFTDDIDTLLN